MAEGARPDTLRRTGRVVAWVATICSVVIGIGLLAAVLAVSDCSFAGGRCPDPDPTFDAESFVAGMFAGVLIVAPPLLLAHRRWFIVAGVTLLVALTLGAGAAAR